jgi:hypothetical protein
LLIGHFPDYTLVTLGLNYYGNALPILRRRANHCRSTDIDLFDCLRLRHVLAHDGLLERVKIHDHHIDRFNVVLGHCGHVLGIIPQCQEGAVDSRMQSLDTAIHHLRKASDLGYIAYFDAGFAESLCGSSRADDFDVEVS